jgi:hypothetical protein
MLPTEQFLRHAVECEEMARFTRDLESKATCAEWPRDGAGVQRCLRGKAQYVANDLTSGGGGSPQLKLFRVGRSRSGEYSRGRSGALSCAPIRRIHPLAPISIKTPQSVITKPIRAEQSRPNPSSFVLEMLTAAVASPPYPPHISGGARPRCGRFGCLGR